MWCDRATCKRCVSSNVLWLSACLLSCPVPQWLETSTAACHLPVITQVMSAPLLLVRKMGCRGLLLCALAPPQAFGLTSAGAAGVGSSPIASQPLRSRCRIHPALHRIGASLGSPQYLCQHHPPKPEALGLGKLLVVPSGVPRRGDALCSRAGAGPAQHNSILFKKEAVP